MSEENVEVVRGYIDAVNAFMRGELSSEAHVESFDPQCELVWHDQRTYPDTPQHLRGAPEVISSAKAPGGDKATFRSTSTSLRSGRSEREGCAGFEYFRHRADALEAAGLSE